MGYKDLLLVLGDSGSSDVLGGFANSFADAFNAHITAAALIASNISAVSFFGEFPSTLVERLDNASENEAIETYKKLAWADSRPDAFEFLKISGDVAMIQRHLAHAARRFDLTIMAQPDGKARRAAGDLIESVLFGSGRPLLLAPFITKGPAKFGKIIAAWDGGIAATRALASAMPLLMRAQNVEVVTVVEKNDDGGAMPGFDITRHLSRHGVAATLKTLPAGDIDVGSMLLSYAADQSADMMVMGGYGHSRLREFFLGGATRSILQSMTLPIFMAH